MSDARAIAGIATVGEHELVADVSVLTVFGTLHQLESMIVGLWVTDRSVADPIDLHPVGGEQLYLRNRPSRNRPIKIEVAQLSRSDRPGPPRPSSGFGSLAGIAHAG